MFIIFNSLILKIIGMNWASRSVTHTKYHQQNKTKHNQMKLKKK